MARGRHAASAAKRRAESAEEQLDRLLPKLVEAQQTAKRYRSEAEATTMLRRQIVELRDALGVPADEHERALVERDALHEQQLASFAEGADVLVDFIVHYLAGFPDVKLEGRRAPYAYLARAMRLLPPHTCDPLAKMLGCDRELRRELHDESAERRMSRADVKAPTSEGDFRLNMLVGNYRPRASKLVAETRAALASGESP